MQGEEWVAGAGDAPWERLGEPRDWVALASGLPCGLRGRTQLSLLKVKNWAGCPRSPRKCAAKPGQMRGDPEASRSRCGEAG